MMIFLKSYTHKELQSLLVSKWKQHPGDLVKLQARIIGSIEGPKFVKPEVSTVTIKVKMYSEKDLCCRPSLYVRHSC